MDKKQRRNEDDLKGKLEQLLREHPGVDADLRDEVLRLFALRDEAAGAGHHGPDYLLENAADSIIIHDFTGNVLALNAVACHQLGQSKEELVGKSLREFVFNFNLEAFKQRLNRVQTRKSYTFEVLQRRRNGAVVPLEINARVVEYHGQPAIMSIGRDLTARKAAETIMQEQKLFLSAVLEHLPVGLAVKQVEPGFVIHMWNPAMEKLTGLSRKEVQGKTDFDIHPPDLAQAFRQTDQRVVEDRAIIDRPEVEVRGRAGSFTARCITVPLLDTRGRAESVLVIMMDVTERIVAEKQLIKAHEELERRVDERTAELQHAHDRLLEAEEYYRALYEQSSEAIFVIDDEGRIEHANPAAREMFGYGEREMRELNPLHLIHPDEADSAPKVMRAARHGEIVHMEVRLRRKDGEFADVEMAAKRIRGGHVLATLWDVTERKRMEQELRDAKVVAERANEAKSEFLANMSHEIRTPMGGILGMTDMVLSMDLNPAQRDYLKGIKDASLSLLDIINDILDFSKIEANKLDLTLEPFVLARRVEGLVETFRLDAKKKGVGLASRLDPDLPEQLVGDSGRLGQVLANLLSNAIKFTDYGMVELDISVLKHDRHQVQVRFTVADTGIGIAPEERSRIFDVFSQLDTSPSKRQPGTGLGLAISRRLVEMMGGEIALESEPGVGSRFSFDLTMGIPKAVPVSSFDASAPASGEVSLRVLLAEDNMLNQEFLTHFLEEAGHSVQVAGNGLLVLEALAKQPFDIVLMDIQMPEMDGIKATQHIRKHDGSFYDPNIPIVALTAYAMKGDKERMLAAGMNDYLTKPVDMPTLLSLIVKLADNR